MTFGPFGVGRLDGKAVMVPHAAPGDLLEVTVVQERAETRSTTSGASGRVIGFYRLDTELVSVYHDDGTSGVYEAGTEVTALN